MFPKATWPTWCGKDMRGTPVTPDSWAIQLLGPYLNFIWGPRKHSVYQQGCIWDNLINLLNIVLKHKSIKSRENLYSNESYPGLNRFQIIKIRHRLSGRRWIKTEINDYITNVCTLVNKMLNSLGSKKSRW
jgi:hypothetical protein